MHKFDSYAYLCRFINLEKYHSSKFTVLVVVGFTKKEERKIETEPETVSKGNTLPSSEYCGVRKRIIPIL